MAFLFEELTNQVRDASRRELASELAAPPTYFSPRLTVVGQETFYALLDDALTDGNEETLERVLHNPLFWNTTERYVRNGIARTRNVNLATSARALAITEFNTWYIRGLCRILIDDGVEFCQVYRAAPAFEPRGECLQHDGQTYAVTTVYEGHRIRYWPEPGQVDALSIPVGVNCHHTIRRLNGT
jgi:hypothetical protein